MVISQIKKERTLRRYDYMCAECGSTDELQIDHIKPLAAGGTDDGYNLQILCRNCNTRKGSWYNGIHYRYERTAAGISIDEWIRVCIDDAVRNALKRIKEDQGIV